MTTTVFVHGVPETSAIWTPVLAELAELGHDDLVRLSPPVSVPWSRTGSRPPSTAIAVGWPGAGPLRRSGRSRRPRLRRWARDQRGDGASGPAAQLGHRRPRRVRAGLRLASPGADLADTRDGEEAIAQLVGAPVAARAAALVDLGIPEPTAGEVVAGQDERMGEAILSLYRSAVQPVLAHRGRNLLPRHRTVWP